MLKFAFLASAKMRAMSVAVVYSNRETHRARASTVSERVGAAGVGALGSPHAAITGRTNSMYLRIGYLRDCGRARGATSPACSVSQSTPRAGIGCRDFIA